MRILLGSRTCAEAEISASSGCSPMGSAPSSRRCEISKEGRLLPTWQPGNMPAEASAILGRQERNEKAFRGLKSQRGMDGWKDDNWLQLKEKNGWAAEERGNVASECGKRLLSHCAASLGLILRVGTPQFRAGPAPAASQGMPHLVAGSLVMQCQCKLGEQAGLCSSPVRLFRAVQSR